mmetsp:Transcript_71695/g.142273  ORF Transcript_71695/g.142273 Transcript_71695/m.142273 type:complete len:95 (-) Transcript_71695:34-318(-)
MKSREKMKEEDVAVPGCDDAHDLFTRLFTPASLQISCQDSGRVEASRVRLDAFTHVPQVTGDTVVQLFDGKKQVQSDTKIFALMSSTGNSCKQR